MRNNWAIIMFFMFVFIGTSAQKTAVYNANDRVYQKAIDLYNNQEYAAAQNFFKKAKNSNLNDNLKANSAYYIAQSAVRLNQSQAESLMTSFVEDYPTHPKRNNAFIGVGNYYFSVGKYALARKWYADVDESRLSPLAKDQYNFNKGYSLYKAKRLPEAQSYFEKVSDSEKYKTQAQYYLGYIAYQADDYDKADIYFEEVNGDSEYKKNLTYYNADRNFKKGNFKKAIEEGKQQLPNVKSIDKSQLNKIIGESYFNLNDFGNAITYLEEYKGEKGKWSNTDHYLLGYAYYKEGKYSQAVSQFNKIINGKNSIAQNAYYHLADAYLKSDQKPQALNAFKNASEMNYEAIIKEDASYNYAKLSYEIGNSFESVPSVLTNFLTKYPSSSKKQEISNYLVDSYLTTKNYKAALETLEKGNSSKNTEVYQKVLFYRAIELHKEKQYAEAISLFDKAIVSNNNNEFTQRSQFWKAESYYLLEEFTVAISEYKKVDILSSVKTLQLKDYQLGYSYFKTKDYSNAISSFKNFLNNKEVSSVYINDATLRLADSYFVSADYWAGIETYNKAIAQKQKRADYAHFQKAISYGFVNKSNQKIENLERFLIDFPSSTYKDDALYALANTYVAEGNTTKGLRNYNRLQAENTKSTLVPKSLLKEGLIYYNADESDKAISTLKGLVAKYPKSAESIQAVKTVRLVYIDLGKTNEYANWVNTLDFVEITNEELDNDTYEAAEKPYQENNVNKAILGFENYLSQFPKGLHVLKSNFYLAQLYSKQMKTEKALPHYLAVAEIDNNEYTETALSKISETYLESKKYDKAIPFLLRLEENADFSQNTIFAQSNLMKSYYEQKLYSEALTFSDKVLLNESISNEIKIDAQIYKARAALALNNNKTAKNAYAEVAKTATGKLGAEAIYNLANFSNQEKDYEISNTHVQRLAKDYSAYREYGAKSLVLMAKNFYGLGDAYQATYVLESVIENFKEYQSTVVDAQNTLEKIKTEQAKVNSSIKNNN